MGAFEAELPVGLLMATGAVTASIVFGGRYVWRSVLPGGAWSKGIELVVGWCGSAAIWLTAVGCSFGSSVNVWLLWIGLGLADQWQLRWFLRDSRRGDELAVRPAARSGAGTDDVMTRAKTGDAIANPKTGDAIAGFMQEVVRVRGEDGAEAVYGVLRAEFVQGQRNAVVHVGFCPALERAPVVTAEVVESGSGCGCLAMADLSLRGPAGGASGSLGGPWGDRVGKLSGPLGGPRGDRGRPQRTSDAGAEVRVVQAFCHGARLEVRLVEAAEEDRVVMVEVMARARTENEELARG
jgi:hypothetical protein